MNQQPVLPTRTCQILCMMLRKFNFPTVALHSMMKQVRRQAATRSPPRPASPWGPLPAPGLLLRPSPLPGTLFLPPHLPHSGLLKVISLKVISLAGL